MSKHLAYISMILAAALTACSDWRNGIPDNDGTTDTNADAISFTGTVVSSRLSTRADATIVHLRETTLPPTEKTSFYAGIFGCYTKDKTWASMVQAYQTAYNTYETATGESASQTGFLASSRFETFKATDAGKNYTANMMFNTKATINTDGTLTYAPLQFWPNQPISSGTYAGQRELCTFWAYYPYNPTAEIGEYGISLAEERLSQGMGMGRVRFTMQPDAANQNDFMISAPVVDCNRDQYPLIEDPQTTYTPKPVKFHFFHMLAQVRLYAYVRGNDKMVYQDSNSDGIPDPADETWFNNLDVGKTIIDQHGNVYTKISKEGEGYLMEQTTRKAGLTSEEITTYKCNDLTAAEFAALGLKVPDESQCVRWDRTSGADAVWDKNHKRRRCNISYKMEFNNIKTTTTFYPEYSATGATIAYEDATTLGSATVNNYVMNPYWFTFNSQKQRDYLSDEYMFGIFEDQDAYKTENNALKYTLDKKNLVGKGENAAKHYNFAPGNILLVVPQKLDDDDVPHIVLTATGQATQGSETKEWTARLTINMLKMNIEWKSGFIYCYAILDELRPGDDIVRGPESITTIFDTSKWTDQW